MIYLSDCLSHNSLLEHLFIRPTVYKQIFLSDQYFISLYVYQALYFISSFIRLMIYQPAAYQTDGISTELFITPMAICLPVSLFTRLLDLWFISQSVYPMYHL